MLNSPNMPAAGRPAQYQPPDRTDLLARHISRWTPRRKLEVLIAIDSGLLSLDEARYRYELSLREIEEWKAAAQRGGITSLQLSRCQQGRRKQKTERKH